MGRPCAPRRRTSCAPRRNRAVVPSGRSQPCKPFASKSGQRTHPKVCGSPNTISDLLVKRPTIIVAPATSVPESAAVIHGFDGNYLCCYCPCEHHRALERAEPRAGQLNNFCASDRCARERVPYCRGPPGAFRFQTDFKSRSKPSAWAGFDEQCRRRRRTTLSEPI